MDDLNCSKLDIALGIACLILMFVLLAGAYRRRREQAEIDRYRIEI